MIDISIMSDQEIVRGIINRDVKITKSYLYEKCYPLFKAVHNKYYSDCDSLIEFINEIYVYIMVPKGENQQSILESFGFRCTLTNWLKIVSENYCRQLFKKQKIKIDDNNNDSDGKGDSSESIDIDLSTLNRNDAMTVLKMMPNRRYSKLLQLRYLEQKSNEETAELLDMSMENYYNKHKLAKAQCKTILKKEGLL